MYSTGKITTTANTTKVVGTNTKWKDNNSLISPEQVILTQNGATIYINSIASIQSNTEMTLSFPVPATVKEAAYNILTTMVHSVSDAANKIVAMNNANVQFSDILNRWATETGTITVTLPDGTKQQLRTAKEMDKQLDGKFDKAGGAVTGSITLGGNLTSGSGVVQINNEKTGSAIQLDGAINGAARINSKRNNGQWRNHILPDSNGTLMQIGDFGIGTARGVVLPQTGIIVSDYRVNSTSYVYGGQDSDSYQKGNHTLFNIFGHMTGNYGAQLAFPISGKNDFGFRIINNGSVLDWCTIYHTANTTKDSNGNLKAASPIVKVFADHIELNEESEGVELKCLHTGIYQLKHVLGLNSDASWGGINGGITIPSGINQLPLIYVDYDVLVAGEQHPFNGEPVPQEEHGDIVIYTSYRKHFDLPQNVQRARLKNYPEFTKLVGDERVELENGAPVDIPAGHWVDVRVNMPSNSIYNQKQAEAEAYAKEEVERVAREEVERAE